MIPAAAVARATIIIFFDPLIHHFVIIFRAFLIDFTHHFLVISQLQISCKNIIAMRSSIELYAASSGVCLR
jgi:hypothetical protein